MSRFVCPPDAAIFNVNDLQLNIKDPLVNILATIQAGYGTLGQAGHVFLDQVNLVNNLGFDVAL